MCASWKELVVYSKNFQRLPPFVSWEKMSRGSPDHQGGANPAQLSGGSLARKSHPPIILELSASRALLVIVQSSAVFLALNPSPNPWHTLRIRWYLFGSMFFSRKTWNPCINTLLLVKDTALFCMSLQINKWPLLLKRSIQRCICWSTREICTHMNRLLLSLLGHWTFPCIRHYLNIHSAAGYGTT